MVYMEYISTVLSSTLFVWQQLRDVSRFEPVVSATLQRVSLTHSDKVTEHYIGGSIRGLMQKVKDGCKVNKDDSTRASVTVTYLGGNGSSSGTVLSLQVMHINCNASRTWKEIFSRQNRTESVSDNVY